MNRLIASHRARGGSVLARQFLCVWVLSLCGVVPVVAQSPSSPGPAPGGAAQGYRVGPGDQIAIAVYGVPDLTHTVRVSNSGKIHVARVGTLDVYRLTVPEIEALIGRALASKGLVNDPWVQVQVIQFRSSTVYVLGEVIQPGQYAMTTRMSLLDLISMAEGLTPYAEPIAFLYRLPGGDRPRAEDARATPASDGTTITRDDILPIDIVALTQGKKPELNLDLRGGDVLYVRRSAPKYFFVVGEVSQPGLYELPAAFENRESGAPMLLSQALARAGGPVRTAKTSKCLLVRALPGGALEQRPFDFEAVLRGRQPDWPIEVNDIIFVPGSTAKTVGYGLLGMLPNIATQGATTAIAR